MGTPSREKNGSNKAEFGCGSALPAPSLCVFGPPIPGPSRNPTGERGRPAVESYPELGLPNLQANRHNDGTGNRILSARERECKASHASRI